MIELSEATKVRVRKVFPSSDVSKVEEHLRMECGDSLPLVDPGYADLAERIRFAVIKLSGGDYTKLQQCIKAAQTDWRDVLVAAGFGEDIKAHLSWYP